MGFDSKTPVLCKVMRLHMSSMTMLWSLICRTNCS